MELEVTDSVEGIAQKGDIIHLNPDNTWEIKKRYSIDELLTTKSEIERLLLEQQSDIIVKAENLIEKDTAAWQILTKLHEKNLVNVPEILKSEITKMATCKDISKLYEELMLGQMGFEGKDTGAEIEKIINSCTKEGGNRNDDK